MSDVCKNWSTWLKKTRFAYMDENQVQQTLNWLMILRNQILDYAHLESAQKIIDLGCGSGLLAFGVIERFQDSVELIFQDKFQDCLDECKNILKDVQTPYNASFLCCDVASLKLEKNYLDRALMRSVLVHIVEKQPVFDEIYRVLKPEGIYCAFEPIISETTRYGDILKGYNISDYDEFKRAEDEFMSRKDDCLVNFSANSLDENLNNAGFSDVLINVDEVKSSYIAKFDAIKSWFTTPPAPNQKTMKERYLEYFEEKKVDNFILEVQRELSDKQVEIISKTALIKATK